MNNHRHKPEPLSSETAREMANFRRAFPRIVKLSPLFPPPRKMLAAAEFLTTQGRD